ncbi:hypothetical protein ABNX05_01645 [Lysinibacillus sp. M3]|uniref:Uncharacterized protein n=1 Tax=Lysinibacillus zambalensis TaxID=3160866 RepID=A0ABV1MPW5_9BACI
MKKKLGVLLFAVSLLSLTSVSIASTASAAGPQCYKVGNVWMCEY